MKADYPSIASDLMYSNAEKYCPGYVNDFLYRAQIFLLQFSLKPKTEFFIWNESDIY